MGGIYFFARVARAREWHRVKVGFPPVITFASLLGVATVLHRDRFTHDHVSFWAWTALYFLAPPLALGAWLANRRRDSGRREPGDPAIPFQIRGLIGALGLFIGAFGLALFIAPTLLIPDWPWKLTPLTARVIAAIFAMQGAALLGIALDERWSVARVMFEAQLMTTPLIALAAIRSRADFEPGGAFTAFLACVVAGWIAMLGLYLSMRRHRQRLEAAPGQAAQ